MERKRTERKERKKSGRDGIRNGSWKRMRGKTK